MSLIPFVGAVQKFNRQRAGYQIERSLRFNSADSAHLDRTPASASNRKTWTWSSWVKRSALTSNQTLLSVNATTDFTQFKFSSTDTLQLLLDVDALNYAVEIPTVVWRDVSAWYHIVLAMDTTQATSTNRVKMYVNGVQQTVSAMSGFNIPAQNFDTDVNSTLPHTIGELNYNNTAYLNGYLTEINFIDGQALTPSSFGEYNTDTGVWQPKAYTGPYGTNGFYLNFSDNSGTTSTTLGKDQAGSNNWTPNNFSVTAGAGNDSLVDTPTNYGTDTGVGGEVRGNYATWNPLDKDDGITSVTNGNLNVVTNGSNGSIKSTIAFPSGKWYWEVTSDAVNSGGTQAVGIIPQSQPPTNNMSDSGKLGYALDVSFSDRKFENGTATSYGSYTQANGAVYMLAFDQDTGKLWYGVNGTWLASGDPATGSNPSSSSIPTSTAYCAAVSDNTVSGTFTANFGQRPFAYTAPSGFKALCTQNLPEPTIVDGSEYFDVATWTGDGVSPKQVVTSLKFQPDFIWDKSRSRAGIDHSLYDSVRGVGSGKVLSSDTTNAEGVNDAIYGFVSSINSNGFTTTAGSTNNWFHNFSGDTYVAWNWKANGAGVSNTAGTITSTVSANTDAGFSIVTWTANGSSPQTIGHGLGVAPSMIITKQRNGADNWFTYHASLGATKNVRLDETAAAATQTGAWNNTAPTSTVFSTGNFGAFTTNGNTLVAYCFAAIPGYSAFGSYTGNGSTDGPFVFTGHRPAFVMLKRTDSTSNWTILDFQREGYNVDNDPLFPNLSNAEGTTDLADLLSNGFKLRTTDASVNASGGTYIYMSLASNPFKYALGR